MSVGQGERLVPGAQHWIGPYTVGFADFDPDTYAAEVMMPTAGDLLLGGLFKVISAFDSGTFFDLAAGDLADGPGVYLGAGWSTGGVQVDSAFTAENGASEARGPEISGTQDNTSKLIITTFTQAALIASDAVDPRVFAYTNQLPTQGSASLWLCFATPVAP